MIELRWVDVIGWRLLQHHVLQRADRQAMIDVVRRIGGLHAQLMTAAELSLWARVDDLSPADVQHALWHERALIKTWAMRGTLHLLATRDFPYYIAAREAFPARRPASWFSYHGVTPDELQAIGDGARSTLSAAPITREQLAAAIAEHVGNPQLGELLRSGWGALLKPSAFRGDLCFGPPQGQNVTFVQPQHWIGPWRSIQPSEAIVAMVERYLGAYGPATSDEFARWWGVDAAAGKRLFRSLADHLIEVDVEGWRAWALPAMIDPIRTAEAPNTIRLLPAFDPYTIALLRQPSVLDQQHKNRVSRPQGWISPAVLVNGRIEGVWEHEKGRKQIDLNVAMFTPSSSNVRKGIEAEAERLGAFLGAPVRISYAEEARATA